MTAGPAVNGAKTKTSLNPEGELIDNFLNGATSSATKVVIDQVASPDVLVATEGCTKVSPAKIFEANCGNTPDTGFPN